MRARSNGRAEGPETQRLLVVRLGLRAVAPGARGSGRAAAAPRQARPVDPRVEPGEGGLGDVAAVGADGGLDQVGHGRERDERARWPRVAPASCRCGRGPRPASAAQVEQRQRPRRVAHPQPSPCAVAMRNLAGELRRAARRLRGSRRSRRGCCGAARPGSRRRSPARRGSPPPRRSAPRRSAGRGVDEAPAGSGPPGGRRAPWRAGEVDARLERARRRSSPSQSAPRSPTASSAPPRSGGPRSSVSASSWRRGDVARPRAGTADEGGGRRLGVVVVRRIDSAIRPASTAVAVRARVGRGPGCGRRARAPCAGRSARPPRPPPGAAAGRRRARPWWRSAIAWTRAISPRRTGRTPAAAALRELDRAPVGARQARRPRRADQPAAAAAPSATAPPRAPAPWRRRRGRRARGLAAAVASSARTTSSSGSSTDAARCQARRSACASSPSSPSARARWVARRSLDVAPRRSPSGRADDGTPAACRAPPPGWPPPRRRARCRKAQPRRSPHDQRHALQVVGRGHEQHPLRVLGQTAHALQEDGLDLARHRQGGGQRLGARELRPGEGRWHLEQREGVAARVLDEPLAHRRRRVDAGSAGEQASRPPRGRGRRGPARGCRERRSRGRRPRGRRTGSRCRPRPGAGRRTAAHPPRPRRASARRRRGRGPAADRRAPPTARDTPRRPGSARSGRRRRGRAPRAAPRPAGRAGGRGARAPAAAAGAARRTAARLSDSTPRAQRTCRSWRDRARPRAAPTCRSPARPAPQGRALWPSRAASSRAPMRARSASRP